MTKANIKIQRKNNKLIMEFEYPNIDIADRAYKRAIRKGKTTIKYKI